MLGPSRSQEPKEITKPTETKTTMSMIIIIHLNWQRVFCFESRVLVKFRCAKSVAVRKFIIRKS